MTRIGIALGANLGDRLGHLREAAGRLAGTVGPLSAASPVYETEPVDCPEGSPPFLNAVVELESGMGPRAVLEATRAIERASGRPDAGSRGRHAPRTVDLDLLYVGDTRMATPDLTIPHPRLAERRFVLEPLAAIRPFLVLPGFAHRVGHLLATLSSDEPAPRRVAGAREWIDEQIRPPERADVAAVRDRLAGYGGPETPLAALTAYDYPTARLVDEAGVDLVLVGDSLGMVVLGYEDTTAVTMEEMLHHTRAARRGVRRALLAADLPFRSYRTCEEAVTHAAALADAGAELVKLEGGADHADRIGAIVGIGIPVLGHIGMLPQRVREEGGYRKKGRTPAEASALIDDAIALEEAGAAAIVLEGVIPAVARAVTARVDIPTIGIGAGNSVDGQILVLHDVIGAFPWFRPPFAPAFGDVAGTIASAVARFVETVHASRPLQQD